MLCVERGFLPKIYPKLLGKFILYWLLLQLFKNILSALLYPKETIWNVHQVIFIPEKMADQGPRSAFGLIYTFQLWAFTPAVSWISLLKSYQSLELYKTAILLKASLISTARSTPFISIAIAISLYFYFILITFWIISKLLVSSLLLGCKLPILVFYCFCNTLPQI